MSMYEKFLEVMRSSANERFSDVMFLSDCLIVKSKDEEVFTRTKYSEDGTTNIVTFGKDIMIKLCEEYSDEIEKMYNDINNIEQEESLGKAI